MKLNSQTLPDVSLKAWISQIWLNFGSKYLLKMVPFWYAQHSVGYLNGLTSSWHGWHTLLSSKNYRNPLLSTNQVKNWSDLTSRNSKKLVFWDFRCSFHYTTLSLSLQYQVFDVRNWMEPWNGHFERSWTPRFGLEWHQFQKQKKPKKTQFSIINI